MRGTADVLAPFKRISLIGGGIEAKSHSMVTAEFADVVYEVARQRRIPTLNLDAPVVEDSDVSH